MYSLSQMFVVSFVSKSSSGGEKWALLKMFTFIWRPPINLRTHSLIFFHCYGFLCPIYGCLWGFFPHWFWRIVNKHIDENGIEKNSSTYYTCARMVYTISHASTHSRDLSKKENKILQNVQGTISWPARFHRKILLFKENTGKKREQFLD